MSANIPGTTNPNPGAFSEVYSLASSVAAPGGLRIAAMIGEGQRVERIVASALGAGNDGFKPDYSSTTDSDGRHFKTTYFPLISNRTTIFKNGIPLVGLEQSFSSTSPGFSSSYDYRLDPTTGRFELQPAVLVDQFGDSWSANAANIGKGGIVGLTLTDINAPTETWTVRCISVVKDGSGNPVPDSAVFSAMGSVSGNLLDSFGNVVTWKSDGVENTNGILKFAIEEGPTGAVVAFNVGDRFTIKVKSGVLNKGDTITSTYIAALEVNSPTFLDNSNDVYTKHGSPSLSNRLSLGAQLAFANSSPGFYAVQAAPSIPRRLSYLLIDSASGLDTVSDCTFTLPFGVKPDVDSNVNLFVTNNVTGEEEQKTLNRVAFYDPTYTGAGATTFINTLTYSYTVIESDRVMKSGSDGVITPTTSPEATLSSASIKFNSDDLLPGKKITITALGIPNGNEGDATVVSVTGGVVTISKLGGFVSESAAKFQVIDTNSKSSQVLITKDAKLSAGDSLRATVVDEKDADFFDPNWEGAFDKLETIECDMVIPLPSQTMSSIFQAAKSHCITMSQIENKKERILITGAIKGLTPENLLGEKDAAVEDLGILEGIQGDDPLEIFNGNVEDLVNYSVRDAYGDTFRCVYTYPDEIIISLSGSNVIADGFFVAAAIGGYFSANVSIEQPITNKTVTGFTIPNTKRLSSTIEKKLSAAGVTVLKPIAGGGKVIWGKTTTISGVASEEEISVIFIRDRISKSIRIIFEDFIGLAEDDTMETSMDVRLLGAARSFVSKRWIVDYRSLSVKRDLVEARQWNLSLEVQPTLPVNWVYISVGIGVLN